jgi:hypothetical protein
MYEILEMLKSLEQYLYIMHDISLKKISFFFVDIVVYFTDCYSYFSLKTTVCKIFLTAEYINR